MKQGICIAVMLALSTLATPTCAQGRPTGENPPVSAPLRVSILDAARQPIQTQLGKPVRFVVNTLNTAQNWAFLDARMVEEDGSPFSYRNTTEDEASQHGLKSNNFVALLRCQPDHCSVVTYRIGPTDVAWMSWASEYGAPKELFPNLGD